MDIRAARLGDDAFEIAILRQVGRRDAPALVSLLRKALVERRHALVNFAECRVATPEFLSAISAAVPDFEEYGLELLCFGADEPLRGALHRALAVDALGNRGGEGRRPTS